MALENVILVLSVMEMDNAHHAMLNALSVTLTHKSATAVHQGFTYRITNAKIAQLVVQPVPMPRFADLAMIISN